MPLHYIKYRDAIVPAKDLGLQTKGKHKGYAKLKTLANAGKRRKGSIDYRKPDKIYDHK